MQSPNFVSVTKSRLRYAVHLYLEFSSETSGKIYACRRLERRTQEKFRVFRAREFRGPEMDGIGSALVPWRAFVSAMLILPIRLPQLPQLARITNYIVSTWKEGVMIRYKAVRPHIPVRTQENYVNCHS
jgi:hypothetical protein